MRRPARSKEDPVQIAIKAYLEATLPSGWIVQHTANKPRSAQQGAREKRLGAKAGWPDLGIYGPDPDLPEAEPRIGRTYFIEVKAPRGATSAEQREMHDRLMDAGFRVGVARSVDEAAKLVARWGLPSRDASLPTQQAAE